HQRLLWLIEVFNKSAIWGHSSTIRVGSKNRRIPRGNDHVGPGQAKILNNIVQERPLLAKVKFSGQRNGFSTEANHPKPRLSDDSVRQYATETPFIVRAANPTEWVAVGPQECLRSVYWDTRMPR